MNHDWARRVLENARFDLKRAAEKDAVRAERKIASKARERERNAGYMRAKREKEADARPFVGVDGEGAGTDDTGRMHPDGTVEPGRQLFMLLRAGEHELFTGKPLSTFECLRFLTGLPKGPIYVGFSLGYDFTMKLLGLPENRIKSLLNPQFMGRTSWTYYKGFAISWLPKNYLMVGRTYELAGRTYVIKGSVRTFYETFGFFQKSFLKVLHEFDIGTPEQRETIRVNKDNRGKFGGEALTDDVFCPFITDVERDYCRLECEFLAELMTKFRTLCKGANLKPRTWNGAGKLSAELHRQMETMTAERLGEVLPVVCQCPHCQTDLPDVLTMARRAYYGGRFECTRHGPVRGVYEQDIRSAYPYQMTQLPCLEHGAWETVTPAALAKLPGDAVFVAPVRFKHIPPPGCSHLNLCGLPVRKKSGRIYWPREGNGTYWSCELRAAAKLGCKVVYSGAGWLYRRQCDCQPFAKLTDLYAYRMALDAPPPGSDPNRPKSVMGYPIKLAINGSYGKLVQRVGSPRWANPIWGGLITAMTRAQIMAACASDPESVVMIATDGIFSTRPLALATGIGTGLGQWEVAQHERVLIVQPGLYFGASRPKTRGVSPEFFHRTDDAGEPYTMRFERAWAAYVEARRAVVASPEGFRAPSVTLPVRLFIGLKLAFARKKIWEAGKWITQERKFSFEWGHKRGPALAWEPGQDCGWSYPDAGSPRLVNHPGGDEVDELDLLREELEDQPDWIDLSPD